MIVNPIKRRPTRKIRVGSVYVGGDAPISIQSMTNTETCDVAATVAQIQRCADAGADIMRVSVPTMEAAAAFGEIRKQVTVPLVADIHFDYKIALAVADFGADCLRINPGNIGSEAKIREVVAAARHHDISMRIGVNAGSLEKDIQKKYGEPTGQALLESAMRHIDILDRLDFQEFKISVKASNVFLTMDAYRLLSEQIDNPLHLGVTSFNLSTFTFVAFSVCCVEYNSLVNIPIAAKQVLTVKIKIARISLPNQLVFRFLLLLLKTSLTRSNKELII